MNGMLKPRRLTIIPLLAAGGAVMFAFETLIPQPVPWAKLGLSNIAGLLALYVFGFKEALAVTWLRVIIAGLFTGGLFSPGFALAFTGGGAAMIGMWGAKVSRWFSPAGVSISGAACHNIGQIAAAYLLFIRQESLWHLLPVMLITSVFTGALVGLAGMAALEAVNRERRTENRKQITDKSGYNS